MKKFDVIEKYWDKIGNAMGDAYEHVLNCDGRVQVSIYIWEDGEIQTLEDVQGSNSYLVPKDWESRELFFITTIEAPFFDVFDYVDYTDIPDDEDAREREAEETLKYLIEDYRHGGVWDKLAAIKEDARCEDWLYENCREFY